MKINTQETIHITSGIEAVAKLCVIVYSDKPAWSPQYHSYLVLKLSDFKVSLVCHAMTIASWVGHLPKINVDMDYNQ